jgi:hypothetical protein
MTETLVSAEIAQALKDKGFNWEVNNYYCGGIAVPYSCASYNANKIRDAQYSAPTLSHAAMWLRSKGVHVFVNRWHTGKWHYFVHVLGVDEDHCETGFPTHDTALSSGILNALKMI